MKKEIELCGVWLTIECSVVEYSMGDEYDGCSLVVDSVYYNDRNVTIFLQGQEQLTFEDEKIWCNDKICPRQLYEIIQEYSNPIDKIEEIINE